MDCSVQEIYVCNYAIYAKLPGQGLRLRFFLQRRNFNEIRNLTQNINGLVYNKMPKQINEIKDFLVIARRKDAKCRALLSRYLCSVWCLTVYGTQTAIKIKKAKTSTKFKVRCSKYLYTLVVADAEKAEKLKQSLPPALDKKEI